MDSFELIEYLATPTAYFAGHRNFKPTASLAQFAINFGLFNCKCTATFD